MTVLLLRLAGPMQSWGVDSRYARRETLRQPSKSGVLGLLAAADGRRRTDPIEDLAELRFGVRVDQPGRLMSDFHTAHQWARTPDGHWRIASAMPLSTRYYLADACFVAGVEGDAGLLEAIDHAISRPKFPLYLGRRSCPATGRISLGVREGGLEEALSEVAWQASRWHRRECGTTTSLQWFIDGDRAARSDEQQVVRDEPMSFDPRRREHGWRSVSTGFVNVPNPDGRQSGIDFFAAVGGA